MKIEDFKVGDVYYINGPEKIILVESISDESITYTIILSYFKENDVSVKIMRETRDISYFDQFLETHKLYDKVSKFAVQHKIVKRNLIERIFSFKV